MPSFDQQKGKERVQAGSSYVQLTRELHEILRLWQASAHGDLSVCEIYRDLKLRQQEEEKLLRKIGKLQEQFIDLYLSVSKLEEATTLPGYNAARVLFESEIADGIERLESFNAARSKPVDTLADQLARIERHYEASADDPLKFVMLHLVDEVRDRNAKIFTPQALAEPLKNNSWLIKGLQELRTLLNPRFKPLTPSSLT